MRRGVHGGPPFAGNERIRIPQRPRLSPWLRNGVQPVAPARGHLAVVAGNPQPSHAGVASGAAILDSWPCRYACAEHANVSWIRQLVAKNRGRLQLDESYISSPPSSSSSSKAVDSKEDFSTYSRRTVASDLLVWGSTSQKLQPFVLFLRK